MYASDYNMDPWKNSIDSDNVDNTSHEFEDNFVPEISQINKLPDSEKYLAVLEEKLHKIKSNPNVVQQLAQKREECLNELLNTSEHISPEDLSLDEPIESPAVLRAILPQKQALTQGEIVELLKYDRLNNSDSTSDLSEQKENDS